MIIKTLEIFILFYIADIYVCDPRKFANFMYIIFVKIFQLVGGIALTVGVWLRTDSRFRDFLSERYRNVVEEAFWQVIFTVIDLKILVFFQLIQT